MVIFQKGARKVKYPMHSNQFEKNDQIWNKNYFYFASIYGAIYSGLPQYE